MTKHTCQLLLLLLTVACFGCQQESTPVAPSTQDQLPAWADFFASTDQLERFKQVVDDYFARNDIEVLIDDGWVIPITTNDDEENRRFGLSNVGQACVSSPESDWTKIVSEHFDNIYRSMDQQQAMSDRLTKSYESAKDHLCVRLWEQADTTEWDDLLHVNGRIPGIIGVVVIDLPESAHALSADDIAGWDVTADQVCQTALANLDRLAPVKAEKVKLKNGAVIHFLTGDSIYGGSWALRLNKHPGLHGKHGALVAIPTRDLVLTIPINDLSIVPQTETLIMLAMNLELEGPGSVTNNIYWHHKGHFVQLPYEIKDQQLFFKPPQTYLDMLNQLTPPSDTEATN